MIGYEKKALGFLTLPDFKYFRLRTRDGQYESPVYIPSTNEIYYISKKDARIYRYRIDTGETKSIYQSRNGQEIKWLLFQSRDDSLLYFYAFKAGRPPHRMIELSTNNGSTRAVFEGNLYPYQRPDWIGQNKIAFLTYVTGDSGRLMFDLKALDVTGGTARTLYKNAGEFAISNRKTRILIKHDDAYRVYRYPDFGIELEIALETLSDKNSINSPFCFLEDKYILFWKWIGRKIGLGSYLYDIEKGHVVHKTRHMLWDMQFSEECPRIK